MPGSKVKGLRPSSIVVSLQIPGLGEALTESSWQIDEVEPLRSGHHKFRTPEHALIVTVRIRNVDGCGAFADAEF